MSDSIKNVSIFGSCVTRDLLVFPQAQSIRLCTYLARQSVVSAVCPPPPGAPESPDAIDLQSKFQRTMVACDINKKGFELLKTNPGGTLIIDLVDERFPLAKIGKTYVTLSNEMTASGFLPKSAKTVWKKPFPWRGYAVRGRPVEEYVFLFCARLLQIYKQEQIIIHKLMLTDYYRDAEGKIARFPANHLKNNAQVNALLNVMYDLTIKRLPGARVIDLSAGFCADEKHKWGLSPMHYEDDYCEAVLEALFQIIG